MDNIVTVNKAKQFYMILKKDIESGKYSTGEKLPSIRDFASMYGISRNTVNTVIAMLANEGFVSVRDGMGTYIAEHATDARQIGVMIFNFSVSMRVDTDILNAIQRNVKPGYYLSLIDTAEDYDVFLGGLKRLVAMGASGIIAVPPKSVAYNSDQRRQINEIIGKKIPLVFVIRNIDDVRSDFFSMDLSKGIIKALEHFAASGKKKVGIVLHDSPKFICEERQALLKWAEPLRLEVQDRYIIDYSDDLEVIRKRIVDILPEIDGLIAPDQIIYKLKETILDCGKKIPGELSIVGINDTLYSKLLSPPLTSIAFPVDKIGEHAINTVIGRIEGSIKGKAITKNIAPQFIIRGT